MSDEKMPGLVNVPATVSAAPKTLMSWTDEQKTLILNTVAKGATPDEFKLFLYRCQHMELDPLVPGMVHFVKYGNNPGQIVIGIEGFRVRAARTKLHNGTKRGVVLDAKGNCVGAWCDVYRKDWAHPAHEEVAFVEYTTGKAMWAKMPQTMIKKVAEAAALRMAFPDALGGVYAEEEMDRAAEEHMKDVSENQPQAAPRAVTSAPTPAAAPAPVKIQKPQQPDPEAARPRPNHLQVIVKNAHAKGITTDELGAYVRKVYKVENSSHLTPKQIEDLHTLMLDEQTDVKLLRYLADPDKFETPFEPEPSPEVPGAEPTFQ